MSENNRPSTEDIRTAIRGQAMDAGFDVVGFAPAAVSPRDQARLDAFTANGEAGDMTWMTETIARRRDPKTLWPEVRSVIVLGMNYGPDNDPIPRLSDPGLANISCYARNRDYHDLIKKRLKRVGRWLGETYGHELKVFVDTAPVMEKALAAWADIGWQGKHTNLVSREYGSWLFLGEIFTSLDLSLPAKEPEDHCGACTRCLDICPTNAFPTPYTLDARRCISYLTIEHKGLIPREFRRPIGNRIYGCDDCLAVCPWNKFATPTKQDAFVAREDLESPRLAAFLSLDDTGFRDLFRGSPVKRIGRDRFIRNVLIAAGNSEDSSLSEPCAALLSDPSPLVRGSAVWALGMLDPAQVKKAAQVYLPKEEDPSVCEEWAEWV